MRAAERLGKRTERQDGTCPLKPTADRAGVPLLVAFTGYSDRGTGRPGRAVRHRVVRARRNAPARRGAALLSVVPPTALITVIADTCYAVALPGFTFPATVVLLAACGANQQVLVRRRPGPGCGVTSRVRQVSFMWRLRRPFPGQARPAGLVR